jgi:hypothetical protein
MVDPKDFVEGEHYYYDPPMGSGSVYRNHRADGLIEVVYRKGKTTDNLGFYSPDTGSYLSIRWDRILCRVSDLDEAQARKAIGFDYMMSAVEGFLADAVQDQAAAELRSIACDQLEPGAIYVIKSEHRFGPRCRPMRWTGDGGVFEMAGPGYESIVIDLDAEPTRHWRVVCHVDDVSRLGLIEQPAGGMLPGPIWVEPERV